MSQIKTIAFVSDAIYPYNKGGKETRLHEITTRLAARGYDVHIYCMKWWPGQADQFEHGVHLHGICPHLPLYAGERRSILQGVVFGVFCFRLLRAKFDVVDVDHMPFFPLYSMRIVCWLKGKKMLATWHEVWGKAYWQEYLPGFKGLIAWWIEKWSVKWPDVIVAVSQFTGKRLKNELGFKGKMLVIPSGVDLEKIHATETSQHSSDVIFAGRLLKHKNVDVLIEAIGYASQQIPKIKALIVGDGPEKANLQTLAKKLQLTRNVIFMPFQSDIKKVYSLIKASKVFVLPSSREGFGLVVLEANACGIPVITVDEPDNAAKELITKKNGIICKANPNSVSKTILSLLKEKITPPRECYEPYDWDSEVKSMAEFYSGLK